jgi:hypothetical protein
VLGWGIVSLVTGGAISSLLDLLAFALIPGIATSVVLWLLLDRLPHQDNGRNAPLNSV